MRPSVRDVVRSSELQQRSHRHIDRRSHFKFLHPASLLVLRILNPTHRFSLFCRSPTEPNEWRTITCLGYSTDKGPQYFRGCQGEIVQKAEGINISSLGSLSRKLNANHPCMAKCEASRSSATAQIEREPNRQRNGMTPISRREVLTGLTASSVAALVTAHSEERTSGAPSKNGAAFRPRTSSTRRCATPLFRRECAPAIAGARWHSEISKRRAQPARQSLFNFPVGLGHALDQPGTLSSCGAAAR